MRNIFMSAAIVALTGCPADAPPAATPATPAPAAPAETQSGFELSTGTDGTSVKYNADGSTGAVKTDDKGTQLDVKVGN